jgi:ABC-type nickel/cobalt efflux system permease component RcnA
VNRRSSLFLLALIGFVGAAALIEPALAQQQHPFSVGGAEAAGAAGGLAGLILSWQAKFHTALQAAARGLKDDPAALTLLLSSSLAYGVFHAAGPGHGKAVLTSYMIASETALRRGLLLAGLAALLQGAVAIVLVGVAALLFRATAGEMNDAAQWIEVLSYAAIAALGARLVFTKGRAFYAALQAPAAAPANRFACEAIDDPAHVHGPDCGHYHAPDPTTLTGPSFRWRDAVATVIAAGLRPCSGAILVLVFTLSQNMFAAGVAAVLAMSAGTALTTGALASLAVYAKSAAMRWSGPESRRALLIGRGAELVAALIVLLMGGALLAGYGLSRAGA